VSIQSSNWIRSPAWDGIFVLSGLPIGAALLYLTGPWYDWPNPYHYGHSQVLLSVFFLAVFLELGHSFSPIVLAWSHAGFRRMMLERKAKFILFPAAAFCACAAVGVATGLGLTSYQHLRGRMFVITNLTNPFPILVWFYMIWNAYHFGMQNFGVLSIYRNKREQQDVSDNSSLLPPGQPRGQRRIDKSFCLALTGAAMAAAFPVSFVHAPWARDFCVTLSIIATSGMLARELWIGNGLPRLFFILADGLGLALMWWQPMIGMAVYSINHWLAAIGLASHAAPVRGWLFVSGMLVLGTVGLLFLTPTPMGTFLSVGSGLQWLHPISEAGTWIVAPMLVCARLGNGIVHFLYDGWCYKFSDPRVRATIGRALFEPPWRTTAAGST
jgi:hypothetical protein